jgi:PKD repeat protein
LVAGSRRFLVALAFAAFACTDVVDPGMEVAELQVAPDDVTLLVGSSVHLVAIGRSACGLELDGDVAWSSDDPTVAIVSQTGLVAAIAAGETMVNAEFHGRGKAHGQKRTKTRVTVVNPPERNVPSGEGRPPPAPPDTTPPAPPDTTPPAPPDTTPPAPPDTTPPAPPDTTPPANQPPVAEFSWQASDLDVTFADQSTDADGSVGLWQWQFGDGATAGSANPSHTYATEGTYSVVLTVTDDAGATGQVAHDLTVTAPEPPPPPPPPQGGSVLIGPSRFDVTSSYPFTMSAQHRVHAGDEREELEPLRVNGVPATINLVGGKHNYKNPDGSFNVDMWKAIIDEFDVSIVQEHVDEGWVLAHYILDEPHAGSRWSGEDVNPALVDEAACHSKSKWPNLPVVVRTHPGWAVREEGAAHDFQCVDIWVAQYSARKGPIQAYVDQNVADAQALGAKLVGGLNVITGGDGSSGIPSDYDPDDWVMSADEVRTYGAAWLASPVEQLGIWRWNNSEWYWEQPDIRAAVEYLLGL